MNARTGSPEPVAVPALLARAGQPPLAWLRHGWRLLHTAAVLAVLLLSPSSYRVAGVRPAIALQLWRGVARKLVPFTLVSSLLGVVLIRIVLETAEGFGLAPLALEAVLRMLVLELIPLLAALFAMVAVTLPAAAELVRLLRRQHHDSAAIDPVVRHVLPRVLAGVVAVPALAALAGAVALLLSYLAAYGPTPWAFHGFTRVLGQVFGPVLLIVFSLKMLAFGAIVALLPAAGVLVAPAALPGSHHTLTSLVRSTGLLLLVEVLALIGIYL